MFFGVLLVYTQYVSWPLQHASEHLRVVSNRYQSSMALLSDLLAARAKLLQANSNLIEAKTQYKIAELEYLRASGRLDS